MAYIVMVFERCPVVGKLLRQHSHVRTYSACQTVILTPIRLSASYPHTYSARQTVTLTSPKTKNATEQTPRTALAMAARSRIFEGWRAASGLCVGFGRKDIRDMGES